MDEKEQKQLLMDLKVVMDSSDCPYIVQFYGAIFKEGDCWICMELMDSSLDKFYHFIFDDLQQTLPEAVIGELSQISHLPFLCGGFKIDLHLREDHCRYSESPQLLEREAEDHASRCEA